MFLDNFQIHVSTDVVMAMVQSKGGIIFKNLFVDFNFRNRISKYYLVTLPTYAMFHQQTTRTKIQPFNGECFSMLLLKL